MRDHESFFILTPAWVPEATNSHEEHPAKYTEVPLEFNPVFIFSRELSCSLRVQPGVPYGVSLRYIGALFTHVVFNGHTKGTLKIPSDFIQEYLVPSEYGTNVVVVEASLS